MMTVRERNELAADIARRVRLYSWQPLPPELAAALGPYGWLEVRQLPVSGAANYATLRLDWTPRPARLTASFDVNGVCNVGRLLWTPEDGS